MASRILGRDSGIGKRWPYRALNILPSKHIWRYLAWKSNSKADKQAFDLGQTLNDCGRMLILLPDSLSEVLICLPIIQSLLFKKTDLEIQFLTNQGHGIILGSIFGNAEVLEIFPSDLFWGEPHFRGLEAGVKKFKPEVVLNFRDSTAPLLCYLLKISQAPVIVRLLSRVPNEEGDFENQYANISLSCTETKNYLRRRMLITSLWNFSKNPIQCKWSRLRPSPDHLKEAAARIIARGLRPESTRLFLWQDSHKPFHQETFRAAIAQRHEAGESKALAILVASGEPFSGVIPNPEETSGLICLEAETTGLLLGFFAQAAQAIGLNGPVLHLASLTDIAVEAHFSEEESDFDTSFLNPKLKVQHRKSRPA